MKRILLIFLLILVYSVSTAQLRIVTPDGGEIYPSGGSIDIVWEGIDDTCTVTIEYSTDDGITWHLITGSATGLYYSWTDAPRVNTNKCLIRIRHYTGNDTDDFILEYILKGYTGVSSAIWSNSGDKLYSIAIQKPGEIWIWNTSSGRIIDTITFPDNGFWDVKISPDSKYFALLGPRWEVMIWDVDSGKVIFNQHDTPWLNPRCIEWSNDGSKLLTYYWLAPFSIELYNTHTWELEYNETFGSKLPDDFYSFITKDSKKVLSFIPDTVFVRDINGKPIKNIYYDGINWGYDLRWYGGKNHIQSIDYEFRDGGLFVANPEGNKCIFLFSDSTYRMFDIEAGNVIYNIPCRHPQSGISGWSPDGKKFSGYHIKNNPADNTMDTIYVWDAASGQLRNKFHCSFSEYVWNPDGIHIAYMGLSGPLTHDSLIYILNIDNGKVQKLSAGNTVIEFSFSPDGKRLAASMRNNTTRIWRLNNPAYIEDISDNTWSIVKPMAASIDIDMGKEIVGYRKDSVITGYIKNPGIVKNIIRNIYFEGTDSEQFSANSGNQALEVESGKNLDVDFHFRPTSIGIKTADVVIVSLADTIRQKIRGEGILPEINLLNNIVDFGKVYVFKLKDSLVLLLENKTILPVVIDSVTLTGKDINQFEAYVNIPFKILANEEKTIALRFQPNAVGNYSADLNFYFKGPDSPVTAKLIGEGIHSRAEISASAVSIDKLLCLSETKYIFTVTNSGLEELIIKELKFSGNNKDDFRVEPTFTPMIIQPLETKPITVVFNPQGAGIRTARIELISNSHIDSLLIIPILAFKDSIALVPGTKNIDLGFLCPGEQRDTVFNVFNYGTVYAGGYAEYTAGLLLPVNEIVLDSGGSVVLPLHFIGKSDEGIFNETITITDSVCGYTHIVFVTGEVLLPRINITNNDFEAIKGKNQDKVLTIINTGKRDLIIPNPPVITPPFKLIGNPFPLTIPAGESREITVRFTPEDTLLHVSEISFLLEPCSLEWKSSAVGKGYIARAKLRAGNAEGYSGDVVEIPVYLEESQYLNIAGGTKFNTDLLFNPTVLSPQDRQITIIDNNTGSVTLENMPLTGIAGEEIARVKFTAALGNAEYNPIYFSNIESDAGEVVFDTISGSFRLLGICRDGGDRLINSNGGVILSIIPNPAGETLEIELGLWESGRTRLYLSDITGNEAKQIFDGNVTTYGKRKLTANLNELAAGVYFVILQTPSGRQSAIIVKK